MAREVPGPPLLARPPAGLATWLEARRRALRAVAVWPALWWLVAVAIWARVIEDLVLEPRRPDAGTFWAGARQLLKDPAHLYSAAAAALRTHDALSPGDLTGFVSPPPVAALFSPLAAVPEPLAVQLWTLADLAMLLLALALFYRTLRPRGLAKPLFWLAAGLFAPTVNEVGAGQVGGPILLLACAALALRGRPGLAGALVGVATSLKYYPLAMLLGRLGPGGRRALVTAPLAAGAILAAGFVPLGLGGADQYLNQVLRPFLGLHNPNCAQLSIGSLVARYVGGETFTVLCGSTPMPARLPWSLPGLVTPLTLLLEGSVLLAALSAAVRSRLEPLTCGCIGLALGAVLPGEIFPYQVLPLLPLLLLVWTAELERGAAWRVAGLGAALAGFLLPTCSWAPVNSWTAVTVAAFGYLLWLAPRAAERAPDLGGSDLTG